MSQVKADEPGDSKIVRVTIEFESGLIRELTGEDAEKWQKATDSAVVMNHIHGIDFPELPWKNVKK